MLIITDHLTLARGHKRHGSRSVDGDVTKVLVISDLGGIKQTCHDAGGGEGPAAGIKQSSLVRRGQDEAIKVQLLGVTVALGNGGHAGRRNGELGVLEGKIKVGHDI